ncbi:MAG: LPS export ABC transporter periplasmic protein LptC [Elusimicrobia bacterium]|nr:LPS export ABC transporter periplasmic protein LptC [Elusimicrobiota bacterium]
MSAIARVGAVLVLLVPLGAGGCRQARPTASEPLQTMEDFVLDQTVHGVQVWELAARSAVLHEEAGHAILDQPRMRFFRDGRVVSRVSSATGKVLVATHDVFLSSSVVLEALEDRSVLETESMTYSAKRDRFLTDAEVLVKRPEGRLRGRGLEAKPDLSEIRIFNQRAVVKEKSS